MVDTADIPMQHVRRIHFIGIGGAGMSGIAEVLKNLEYDVSGSDRHENRMTRHLASLGVEIFTHHSGSNVDGADVVVYSSAIPGDNPELVAAREQRIPVVPRAEMLAELMRFRRGIAVAGTHGKTTTTSLIASVLAEAGMDPTFIIGGLVHAVNSHARLGTGDFLVAEADESDASFLLLNPLIAVLTNIDADHMETYAGDFSKLKQSFVDFFKRLPFYGLAVVCIDDDNARSLLPELRTRVITYGKHENADIRGFDFVQNGPVSVFRVANRQANTEFEVSLNMPGEHNMLNALAAIAVAAELRVEPAAMSRALGSFQGIGRRCQALGNVRFGEANVTVIDDYGHHPSEIRVTVKAVRDGWPGRRLVVAFQPHRYTRTRDLFEDFVEVLNGADQLLVLEVYPAGESPIPGADGRALCRAIRLRGKVDPLFVAEPEQLQGVLADITRDNDVVLLLGAGSIGRVAEQIGAAAGGGH
tara:strand:- start:6107 stop:7525 length:1419 start_codon:yes stop_codon:yes gene_type:complete